MEQKKRSSFSSRIGFVLAAAGSAVGLGNLWRFPYLAARYGGGIFLLVYLILALTFGFSLMITEIAIGRKTRLSCIGAYKALDKRFGFLGWLAAFVPFIITPYYCVIGGWVMKYLFTFISGNALEAADNGGFSAISLATMRVRCPRRFSASTDRPRGSSCSCWRPPLSLSLVLRRASRRQAVS